MTRPTPAHFRPLLFACLLLWLAPPARAQRARRPAPAPPRARFTSGASAPGITFELTQNLILVAARVNDSAPLWFIFDTGADSTVLDATQVERLKLAVRGRVTSSGGAGAATADLVPGTSVSLPGAAVDGLTVAALPLDSFASPLGRRVDGVLGNDFIRHFVVEIDYAARRLSLYAPAQYRHTGARLPMTIEDGLPFVTASVTPPGRAPLAGKFELDTGSTGALLLNTPFVRRHGLLRAVAPTVTTRIGGVGGTAAARLGRVARAQLGPFALPRPVVRLSLSRRGDYASARYDGLIGGDIFRRFKVVFDLAGRTLGLEPNGELAAPFEVDMSGLELLGDGPDYATILIDEVVPHSPAAEAGVEGGETLQAIDGRPAAEFTLEEVRRLFTQAGREYRLTLLHAGRVVEVRLKLRRRV
ncbi:MAG TPA: aspartyl protease family protein [Pyrinomonadaceae bacterium]|jgi:hypothetical protein